MTARVSSVDFYSTDSLLQEEERAVRRPRSAPGSTTTISFHHRRGLRRRPFPKQLNSGWRAGCSGANLPEEYVAPASITSLRPDHAGAGARRFGCAPSRRCRAARHVPGFWPSGRTSKKEVAAQMGAAKSSAASASPSPDLRLQPPPHDHVAKETKGRVDADGPRCGLPTVRRRRSPSVWAKTAKIDDVESIRGFSSPPTRRAFGEGQKGKLSLPRLRPSELVRQDVRVPRTPFFQIGGLQVHR